MLWEHGVAGSNPAIPICPCDGTGIRAGIRVQILQLPYPSGTPNGEREAASLRDASPTRTRLQILSGVLSSRGGTEDALDRGSSFLQVQILSGVPKYLGVAQLVAREFRELQVVGSIPTTQTLPL